MSQSSRESHTWLVYTKPQFSTTSRNACTVTGSPGQLREDLTGYRMTYGRKWKTSAPRNPAVLGLLPCSSERSGSGQPWALPTLARMRLEAEPDASDGQD